MKRETINLFKDIFKVLEPPPDLTLSQWADKYRRLSSESGSKGGRWHTDKAPWQRERIIVRQMGPAEPEAARGCSLYHRSFFKVTFTSWELAHPASSSCRRLPVQHRINIGC